MAAQHRTTAETEIRQLIDGFQRAIRAKDLSAVLSVYAPDIVSFDLVPPCSTWGSPPTADPGKPPSRPSTARSAMR
jgi:ketosteroid isomerase-like protein